MHEVVVVREIVLDVVGRIQGIRRIVMVRQIPVGGEDLIEPRDRGGIVDRDAQFPPQIKCAAVEFIDPTNARTSSTMINLA